MVLPLNHSFISWWRLCICFLPKKIPKHQNDPLIMTLQKSKCEVDNVAYATKEFIIKILLKSQHLIWFTSSECILAITIQILLSVKWRKLIFIILTFTFEDKGLMMPLDMKGVQVMLWMQEVWWEGSLWPSLENTFHLNEYAEESIYLLHSFA